MITIIRIIITIVMLLLLILQIYKCFKGTLDEVLFICLIIQILNLISIALGLSACVN